MPPPPPGLGDLDHLRAGKLFFRRAERLLRFALLVIDARVDHVVFAAEAREFRGLQRTDGAVAPLPSAAASCAPHRATVVARTAAASAAAPCSPSFRSASLRVNGASVVGRRSPRRRPVRADADHLRPPARSAWRTAGAADQDAHAHRKQQHPDAGEQADSVAARGLGGAGSAAPGGAAAARRERGDAGGRAGAQELCSSRGALAALQAVALVGGERRAARRAAGCGRAAGGGLTGLRSIQSTRWSPPRSLRRAIGSGHGRPPLGGRLGPSMVEAARPRGVIIL